MEPNILPQPTQTETPVTQPDLQPINKIPILKNKWKLILVVIIFLIIAGAGGYMLTRNLTTTPTPTPTSIPTPTTIPIRGVPKTSASAITSPPSSMEGINTHTEVFGQGSDPDMITLGPKLGSHPENPPYATHHGMIFEMKHGTPVLAPLDMTLVGYQNNSDTDGIGADGQKRTPFNDIMLFFDSASPDWPGMVIVVYHLYSSSLLRGHYQDPDCGDTEPGKDGIQTEGHVYFDSKDYVTQAKGKAVACKPLLGYTVKRGELIGFAGSVGTHSFVDFAFKVSDTSENPIVKEGNRYLHWVQPGSFFYWKSYGPDAIFPSGVLAYPFETDGYQLPAEQRDVNFKYSPKK